MAHRQDGLPATSLLLLATALLLFGVGGGLVGYMAGERQGERRAAVIVQALGRLWETQRGEAKDRFDGAIGNAAALLEKAAADLKAEVSMYHGCGAICGAIAHQFSEELLHARDAIKKVELPPLANWKDALRQDGISIDVDAGPADQNAPAATVKLEEAYSNSTVIAVVALLGATVALCFGIACFTVLKLRAAGSKPE
jgi:hypothetical protein